MSDTLQGRVEAAMMAAGVRDVGIVFAAVYAAVAEVARVEERHAKEKAEWEKERQSLIWCQRDAVTAARAEWEKERQSAIAVALASERGKAFMEKIEEKQAAVAADRAAEKERVLAIVNAWHSDNFPFNREHALYPPAKVTLPSGWYWVKDNEYIEPRWNDFAEYERRADAGEGLFEYPELNDDVMDLARFALVKLGEIEGEDKQP